MNIERNKKTIILNDELDIFQIFTRKVYSVNYVTRFKPTFIIKRCMHGHGGKFPGTPGTSNPTSPNTTPKGSPSNPSSPIGSRNSSPERTPDLKFTSQNLKNTTIKSQDSSITKSFENKKFLNYKKMKNEGKSLQEKITEKYGVSIEQWETQKAKFNNSIQQDSNVILDILKLANQYDKEKTKEVYSNFITKKLYSKNDTMIFASSIENKGDIASTYEYLFKASLIFHNFDFKNLTTTQEEIFCYYILRILFRPIDLSENREAFPNTYNLSFRIKRLKELLALDIFKGLKNFDYSVLDKYITLERELNPEIYNSFSSELKSIIVAPKDTYLYKSFTNWIERLVSLCIDDFDIYRIANEKTLSKADLIRLNIWHYSSQSSPDYLLARLNEAPMCIDLKTTKNLNAGLKQYNMFISGCNNITIDEIHDFCNISSATITDTLVDITDESIKIHLLDEFRKILNIGDFETCRKASNNLSFKYKDFLLKYNFKIVFISRNYGLWNFSHIPNTAYPFNDALITLKKQEIMAYPRHLNYNSCTKDLIIDQANNYIDVIFGTT